MSRYGASTFPSLLKDCVLWAPLQDSAGVSGGIDEFPILPSGVTATNNGTFTKTDLGNNKSVLNFDGSTNYISLTTNEAWNWGSGYYSVFCWVKFVADSPSKYLIIWSHYLSDSTRIQLFYKNVNGGGLGFDAFTSGTITIDILQNSYKWDFGVWYHVGVVKDATNIKLYKNGEIVVTGSLVTYADHSGVFLIGDGYTATVAKVNGNIKDLMIFKGRALTQPEIELLMNRTHPITGAGLLDSGRYYKLS